MVRIISLFTIPLVIILLYLFFVFTSPWFSSGNSSLWSVQALVVTLLSMDIASSCIPTASYSMGNLLIRILFVYTEMAYTFCHILFHQYRAMPSDCVDRRQCTLPLHRSGFSNCVWCISRGLMKPPHMPLS